MKRNSTIIDLFRHAQQIWITERPTQISAALAYYGLLSLAPLLFIAFALSSYLPQQYMVVENVDDQVGFILSQEQFSLIEQAVETSPPALDLGDPLLTTIVGAVVLVYSASVLFNELQYSLNRVWGLGSHPKRPTISFIRKRSFAFMMVFGISFLLIISSQADLALTYADAEMEVDLPILWIDLLLIFILLAVSLALIYKILPETRVAWRDVWLGSLITAVFVLVGGYVILYYLSTIEFSSALDVASFIALMLIGINYISLIIVAGAVFSKAYAETYGSRSGKSEFEILQTTSEELS